MANWQKADIIGNMTVVFFGLFFVFLAWATFLLALAGIFYQWLILILFFGGLSLLFILWRRNKISLAFSVEFVAIFIGIILLILVFSYFITPTIFSGRDQGSISEAAIRLSQNHQLDFSAPASREFFKIYGPGKALNFPGFYYLADGKLITQFPVPYIAWLAIFYSFFGLSGLAIANAVLLFIFSLSIYWLARIFSGHFISTLLLVLVITSFPVFWFFKFTLSENMALALVWLGILSLVLFLKKKNDFYFFSTVAALGLLAFTRIEGFLMLAMLIIILVLNKESRAFLASYKLKRIIFPLIFLAIVFLPEFFINFPFFKEMGKGIFSFFGNNIRSNEMPFAGKLVYNGKIFFIYGIIQYLVLGSWGVVYFLKRKEHLKLVPFILVSPIFFYLFDANISSDHPWMLRRFVFAVVPALIFYTSLFLFHWLNKEKKQLLFVIFSFLIIFNFTIFFKFAFFSENKGLLSQVQKLSLNFSKNDLVLVDRLSGGDGWAMISGPLSFLYGKQAVYFFNPDDLAKINLEKFDKIYLIVPEENVNFYQQSDLKNRMKFYRDYIFNTRRLDIGNSNTRLPGIITAEVKGKIFEIIP